MDNERTPGALDPNDGLGPPPEDALRQQAFSILSPLQSGTEDVVRLDAALAAVAAERERCEALEAALRAVHDYAGWHTDDDADEDNDSPDDMAAHLNGLIRKTCAKALGPNAI